jgi:hypothetical protein
LEVIDYLNATCMLLKWCCVMEIAVLDVQNLGNFSMGLAMMHPCQRQIKT